MKFYKAALAALVAVSLGFSVVAAFKPEPAKKVVRSGRVETIYVQNVSPLYMSDKTIQHDIPAWEQAANKDFAPVWGTPQVKIVLLKKDQKAPNGAIVATFTKDGPVKGALAYHYDTPAGAPGIVVYTGVGDFYGYNNSVSFTHELFELLADPTISQTNQGYPFPTYCLDGVGCAAQAPGTVWSNEVSDAVEAFQYGIHGVQISDFIYPNWFNDQSGPSGYDFMGVVTQPFEITPDGYSCYWDGAQWTCLMNFGHSSRRDPAGFMKGEHEALRH